MKFNSFVKQVFAVGKGLVVLGGLMILGSMWSCDQEMSEEPLASGLVIKR